MIELSRHHLKHLVEQETSPCVSVYIAPRPSKQQQREVRAHSLAYVGGLLRSAYNPLSCNDLLGRLEDVLHLAPVARRHGLAAFISPEFSGWIALPHLKTDLAVVADSFHVKPLQEHWWHQTSFLMLKVEGKLMVLLEGDSERIQPLGIFSLQSQSYRKLILERAGFLPATLFVCGAMERVEIHNDLERDLELSQYIDVFDLGADIGPSLANRAARVANRINRRRQREELLGLYHSLKADHVQSDTRAVVNSLAKGHAQALYWKKDSMLWGRVDWNTQQVQTYSQQKNAHDDDLVDDFIEQAARKNIPVIPIESAHWPLASPVAVKTQN